MPQGAKGVRGLGGHRITTLRRVVRLYLNYAALSYCVASHFTQYNGNKVPVTACLSSNNFAATEYVT